MAIQVAKLTREFVYNGTIDVASIRIWLRHPSNEDP